MSIEAIAWAFKQPVSPSAKKFVLVALADNADTYGICFPSYRHIEKKTALTKRAIINNINALVNEGVIQRAGRIRSDGSDTSNAYRLPIVDGCIDGHPLSSLFIGEGVNEIHSPVQEMHPPMNEIHSGGEPSAPREPSLNRQLTEREREPLTRQEFLRGVNKGFQDGGFGEEFGHLTESEIARQAAECWDRWGGNLKGRDPVMILRTWLRKGISLKTVRKAPPETAQQESAKSKEPDTPLQDWHEKARKVLGEAVFRSWIRPLHHDGNGTVYAPSKFIADWCNQHYHRDITGIVGNVQIIHQPEKEKEPCTT